LKFLMALTHPLAYLRQAGGPEKHDHYDDITTSSVVPSPNMSNLLLCNLDCICPLSAAQFSGSPAAGLPPGQRHGPGGC
jgi:hypothetical protein